MKFERRYEDLELQDQKVRILELSAAEFEGVTELDESNMMIELIYLSLEHKPESKEDILHWPTTIVNQLSSSVMALNGLTEQGN